MKRKTKKQLFYDSVKSTQGFWFEKSGELNYFKITGTNANPFYVHLENFTKKKTVWLDEKAHILAHFNTTTGYE